MSLADKTEHKYTNHLADENSPYLLAHAHNPVDWYPWGDDALAKAKAEDKPIFLSIGYAACHWCHVMERESFESEDVAAILNEHFVSIKVDREQRPDIDQIYMSFTTAMTGSGGWPMSVFLTPDLKPFFAGTYFPAVDNYGKPSFRRLITEISKAYREDKNQVVASAQNIFGQVTQRLQTSGPGAVLTETMVTGAARGLMANIDNQYGGFGNAPKFPHAPELSLLLRQYGATGDSSFLEASLGGLRAMANGGIYDHLGGGFARYSTDRAWLVPHFEKMLYDNGLLVPVYAEAWQITGDEFYLRPIRETLDWIIREMTAPNGGFYSAVDADSEGEEGKFYVWSEQEIVSILGAEDAAVFNRFYNVTRQGNFEGHNILNMTDASEKMLRETTDDDFEEKLSEMRRKLYDERLKRIPPLTDDKILTSWNGLALTAFCKGYQITGDQRYLDAAGRNADFVLEEMFRDDRLTHSYREGRHSTGEFLEDYAYYIRGLLDLFETDQSRDSHRWIELAQELASNAVELFMDDAGVFYLRPDGQDDLIVRPRDEFDGSIPAPGSIMIENLFKLNRITGDKSFVTAGEKALHAISGRLASSSGLTSAVMALDYYLSDKIEIVIVGNQQHRQDMVAEIYGRFLPNRLVAVHDNGDSPLPLFEGRTTDDGEARAYLCRNSVCGLPALNVEELREQLKGI